MMRTIGEKIKKLRLSIGYSQEKLAEELEVSTKSIQRYETDKSRPDTHTLIQLATFFGVSIDYIVGLTGKKSEMDLEKKFFPKGEYQSRYKMYVKCRNQYHLSPDFSYYWIFWDETGEFGGISQWAGWANQSQTLELRELRPLTPTPEMVSSLSQVYGKPLVINSAEDVEIFCIFGGHALIRTDLCKRYLPIFCEKSAVPDPAEQALRDLYG